VDVETDQGNALQVEIGLDEMPKSMLFGTRHAFKNYFAFVNPGDSPVSTIFHARPFEPNCGGATFSGCGQINPLKRWVAPPVAMVPKQLRFQKKQWFYRFKIAQKTCEGSLHPRPEGRGIRDPPRSRCNNKLHLAA